ncbi:HD domain-containing protein [Phaeobacter marinintestinus]|uniref:HD domain-containing protein n=1 Tax=Falsiphaeobacter marinintestinus TaxID=1492905 RepID=UPI001646C28C|nr:HD domain-containing protein [Phaeobacter marinintestinus]
MLPPTPDLSRYDDVWRKAEPYMRARKNDVHIPLSFGWAQMLLDHYPEANRDICSLAILLHDIGWYSIDNDTIISEGFRSDNYLQSDVRYLHETEGVRLGTVVLRATGWGDDIITEVCEIIDGHDTRPNPHHLNDRIVRDADKLWRFSVTGIAVASDWFGKTPHQYADHLGTVLTRLETDHGQMLAERELAASRAALMLHVI